MSGRQQVGSAGRATFVAKAMRWWAEGWVLFVRSGGTPREVVSVTQKHSGGAVQGGSHV